MYANYDTQPVKTFFSLPLRLAPKRSLHFSVSTFSIHEQECRITKKKKTFMTVISTEFKDIMKKNISKKLAGGKLRSVCRLT